MSVSNSRGHISSKFVLAAIATLMILPYAFAIPNFLNVQGKLTNINDEPRTGEFNFTFSLYNQSSGGTLYWQETKKLNTTGNGFWSTLLGSSTSLNLTFDRDFYLEVALDGETLSPRFRLASSAYTFRAESVLASNVTNGTFQTKNYVFPENVTIGRTLTATNLSGSILCSNLVGGGDGDFCNDAIGTPPTGYGASNITSGTFGSNFGNGSYIFPDNLTINKNLTVLDKIIGDLSLGFNINLSGVSSGFLSQSRISGITLPAGNISGFITQSQISGITIPFDNTTGQVVQSRISGITIPIANVTGQIDQSKIAGITLPANNVTNGTFASSGYVFPHNLVVARNLTVSNNVLFVDNNTGRVGIGTTSPGSTLVVQTLNANSIIENNAGFESWLYLNGGVNVVNDDVRIKILSNGTDKWDIEKLEGSNDLRFKDYNGTTSRLFLQSGTGNVGIGTTAPQALLSVNGTFIVNQSGTTSLFVTSGNLVGINTTSPPHLLTVRGGDNKTLLNVSDGLRTFGVYVGALSGGGTGASAGTMSEHPFRLYTNNTDRISIDTAGRVGIGTSSPNVNSTLEVKGNVTVAQQNNVANNTWQFFYDTTGVCRTKMGYNGTHFLITSC